MAANQSALQSIDSDAESDLRVLAKWLETAKMAQQEEKNQWRCVDPGRFEMLQPFLDKLNLQDVRAFLYNL